MTRRTLPLLLLFLLSTDIVLTQKIKHVIVLMEENRSFDHLFGYYPGVNGLTGKEYNLVNTSDPQSKRTYVDKNAPYVGRCDPDHSTNATKYKIFGADAVRKGNFSKANMNGFVEFETFRRKTNACDVMSMFTPEKVPVLTAIAQEYALFDRFFCAHAGPTWPNRMFFLSGTSAGLTETGVWYHDTVGKLFPQKTIFDQVAQAGLTWKQYYNDTPWELFMESLAHNPSNFQSMEQFFSDCKTGNLPNFGFINPLAGINISTGIGSNDMHPDHDVAASEQYYKDIYEAIRASPQWNETLFIITFDEHGGFYDHVPTPLGVPPPGDGEKSYPDDGILFDRLGVRIPTLLISPWIPKGTVISEPPNAQKPFPNSEYDLTSIMSTVRKLLGINLPPLTQRDAWSATFEHVLSLNTPRSSSDCPTHLPPAPPPAKDNNNNNLDIGNQVINDLQRDIMTVLAHLSGVEYPSHVEQQKDVSDWAATHFENHVVRTSEWKKSKGEYENGVATYKVVCQPAAASNWVDPHWEVNHVSSVPIMTVSTRKLTESLQLPTTSAISKKRQIHEAAIPYCLDAGAMTEHTTVTVSLCYPSQDPTKNRDKSQQWIFAKDATLRPYFNQALCLTNFYNDGIMTVSLESCVDGVDQHWAFDGKAPGNDGDGSIYFGANALGVVAGNK